MSPKDLVRFERKMQVLPTGCWQWTAYLDQAGYGRFSCGGMGDYAHRIAYEHSVGRIPKGLQIDHLCKNRACVNPAHMEAVTCRVNILRGMGVAAKNAIKTHCKYGHEFSTENTRLFPTGSGYGRQCRKCYRLANQAYYYRTKRRKLAG